MDINEIKTYFETNKDNDDVKNYIGGLVTPDRVNAFLETEDGKKLIQPKIDGHFTKGLKSWQDNNLQKLIDEAVAKANPQETAEQKQIRELTERLNKKEVEEKRQILMNKGLLKADEKKLPKEIIEYFLGDSEETTYKNLETLEKVLGTHIETAVKTRLGEGYKPPTGSGSGADSLQEQVRKSLNNY